MSGAPSAKTSRAPTAILSPSSPSSPFAAICARTTPATELRSAMPRPESPSVLARSISSSAWEAPRRKEKLVVTASSAYADMGTNPSREQAVQEPARLARFTPIEAFAVEPDAQACGALHAEIIPRQRPPLAVAPPFHGDAL